MSGFEKWIPSTIQEYEIFEPKSDGDLLKMASSDLPADFVYDPDYLYLWVRIVSAGEYYGPNKNGDYFPEQELIDYYHTFKNAHPFKNHENKKIENAIGQVLDVRWNPVMKCVEVFKGIDRKRAPEIVRGFQKGYLTDVSMGCRVPYTVCSVCGNKAKKRSEFCVHVNKYRMQYLGNGERVFEINYEPSFHDSSVVLSGAERVAKALMIIDGPPAMSKVAFQKVASARDGYAKYVRLSDYELEKVAHFQEDIHPFFKERKLDKTANQNDLLYKLAEIEKELTGKILNIVNTPDEDEKDATANVMSIVKFLTEKRMDEENTQSIADTLLNIAESEKIDVHKVFSTFLGIAELLGIELYPNELHQILSKITDAKLKPELDVSPPVPISALTPSHMSRVKHTLSQLLGGLPSLGDPSELHELYNEGAHETDMLSSDPDSFVERLENKYDFEDEPSPQVVKVIRVTLKPLMSARSSLPQFLIPRLIPFLQGMSPIVGNPGAVHDYSIMNHPRSIGDLLANIAYKNYQSMRPVIVRTKMVRLAKSADRELEKLANQGYGLEVPYSDVTERTLMNSVSLDKVATEIARQSAWPSGSYNALNDEVLAKFAQKTKLPTEKVAVIKTATLLQSAGMDKEAGEWLQSHQLPISATGLLLKHATLCVEEEMHKIANDYAANLLMDSMFLPSSISTTIPGRLLDAYVFTKITQALKPKDPTALDHTPKIRMGKNVAESLM